VARNVSGFRPGLIPVSSRIYFFCACCTRGSSALAPQSAYRARREYIHSSVSGRAYHVKIYMDDLPPALLHDHPNDRERWIIALAWQYAYFSDIIF
jgi:hypothetical protein